MKTENSFVSYSLEALRVKARFYNKRAMVYVEGDDDLCFWDQYFDREIFQIESLNGCKNLKPYIERLEAGERSYIVACDADYSAFVKGEYLSPMVVTTYGHSIENMMYCPHNLNEAVKHLARTSADSYNEITRWYKKFVESAHPLLVREITNLTYNPKENKVVVFGDSCAQYCKQKPCYELDDDKIVKFCKTNEKQFPKAELDKTEKAIAEDKREERHLIKGHFYTDAVGRFLSFITSSSSKNSKGVKTSHRVLYALMVNCGNCHVHDCTEKSYIESKVANAINNLEIPY